MTDILIIDDEELVRDSLGELLRREGYSIDTAGDGVAGLEKFKAGSPAVVIVDIVMPEKEGIETIKELKQLRPDLAIIAISGGGRTGNKSFLDIARKVGADVTLAKPFKRAAILQAVSRCIGATPAA